MKVIIVGGGISGLTTYLFLEKLVPSALHPDASLEIHIYESHEAPQRAARPEPSISAPFAFAQGSGGVLGISPNGVRVLQQLDQELFEIIVNQGYPVSRFQFRNSHGSQLAEFPTTSFADPPLHTVLISRQNIWDTLRDRIPDSAVSCKNVSSVAVGTSTQRPRVQFADGSPDEAADLIIGADGVRSVVKRAVNGDGKTDPYPAVYEGLVGVGGFMSSSYLSSNEPLGISTMTFGADGFFGYGACTPVPGATHNATSQCNAGSQAVWWSTYALEQPPERGSIAKDDIIQQLQSRHSKWKDPVIQKVLQEPKIDSIYPTWVTPNLPTWQSNGVILVGDAAHALQTSSGQGVSQALEDAEMLGMLLARSLKCLGSEKDAIKLTAESFCQLRMPRVQRISDYAKRLGDQKRKKNLMGEWVMYAFIWLGGKLPRGGNIKSLLQYDPEAEIEKVFKDVFPNLIP